MFNYAIPILASLNEQDTISFYTQKLGFTFHSSWDGYLIFSRDGMDLHLSPCENPAIPKETGCYINVTGIDKLYAELQPLDILHPEGELQEMPWGMKQFSILDNNGNIIHFGEEMDSDRHVMANA